MAKLIQLRMVDIFRFRNFVTESFDTDVTLVSDDLIPFQAHKLIISASSTFFKCVLLNDSQCKPIIFLRDVHQTELKCLLQLLYLGETSVLEKNASTFFKIMTDLGVRKENVIVANKPLINSTTEDTLFSNASTQQIEEDSLQISTNMCIDGNGYSCADCHLIFEKRFLLLRHRRSKHDILMFSCYQCEYQASNDNHLKIHQETKHKLTKRHKYPCDKCGFCAPKPSQLKIHQEAMHNGVRYSCDKCEYQATRPGHLKSHEEYKHKGVRYFCNQCDFQAKRPAHLKTHEQAKHKGITYSCNQCSYKAARQSHLQLHQEAKHGNAVYSCNQCDYQATQPAMLKVHKRTRHK